MQISFVNSAHIDAPGFVFGIADRKIELIVRYAHFVHPKFGHCIIDTGYTSASTDEARSFALKFYNKLLRPKLAVDGQLENYLATQGITPKDVSHVLISHFHADHVSGLNLLTNAQFHASADALAQIRAQSRLRQIRHGHFLELLPEDFYQRLSPLETKPVVEISPMFSSCDVFDDGSVLAVPLPGHDVGHFGFIFNNFKTPLFYAVDAHWLYDSMVEGKKLKFPMSLVPEDRTAMRATVKSILDYLQISGAHLVLCHDAKTQWCHQ